MTLERLQAMVEKQMKLQTELKQLPAQARERAEKERTLKLLDAEIQRLQGAAG
jgi:hypothetical protein